MVLVRVPFYLYTEGLTNIVEKDRAVRMGCRDGKWWEEYDKVDPSHEFVSCYRWPYDVALREWVRAKPSKQGDGSLASLATKGTQLETKSNIAWHFRTRFHFCETLRRTGR